MNKSRTVIRRHQYADYLNVGTAEAAKCKCKSGSIERTEDRVTHSVQVAGNGHFVFTGKAWMKNPARRQKA